MLCVTGFNTTIIRRLISLLPEDEGIVRIHYRWDASFRLPDSWIDLVYYSADRYAFAHGLLRPKSLLEQTPEEIAESLSVNLVGTLRLCEAILQKNARARICLVGSMSGIKGSYDTIYAASKAAIHQYVKTKKLVHGQQLVAVAPGVIIDSGMTIARHDLDAVLAQAKQSRHRRLITALEVARMVKHLLYVDEGFTTNVVIPMSGEVSC